MNIPLAKIENLKYVEKVKKESSGFFPESNSCFVTYKFFHNSAYIKITKYIIKNNETSYKIHYFCKFKFSLFSRWTSFNFENNEHAFNIIENLYNIKNEDNKLTKFINLWNKKDN